MNLKITRVLTLIVLTCLVASSGCTSTTGPAPQTTLPVVDTRTPLPTATLVTRVPESEVARIVVDHFGLNPATETVYEFLGKVQVSNGIYQSVQVVLRYPDGQEYTYDAGGMGGSNQTIKAVFLFPAERYMGAKSAKILVLDGRRYSTAYRYDNGALAWIATSDTLIAP